ncbi:MAG: helix-turn-helix domain-containing protein [Thermodesulfobacteriota bacterium]
MPRPGLRLAEAQCEQLIIAFQRARDGKDLDTVSRIQGLLLVSEAMGERSAAQIVGEGRGTLQDWIFTFRQRGVKGLVRGPYPAEILRQAQRR